MTVKELSKEQFMELKTNYLFNIKFENESVSYDDLVNIDNVISDAEVINYYAGTSFTDDDFFCSSGD